MEKGILWTARGIALALLVLLAVSADPASRPRCEDCGMYYDKSSTKVEAVVRVNGEKGTHIFESMGCLYRFLHKADTEAELLKLSVLDYTTFGAESEKMLDGKAAIYLFGTKPLGGSMEPYVAAFADARTAESAKASLDGKVRTWDELQESLERAQRKADKKKEGKQ